MSYSEQVKKAMNMLAKQDNVIFLGQNVVYKGQLTYPALEEVPVGKKIELPIIEDTQMGMSIGLSLAGYLPVSIYPRMDFLLCAMNQLVSHLDKVEEMSHGEFRPRVIIRTVVDSREPLDSGPQHCSDYSLALMAALKTVKVVRLFDAKNIMPAYRQAMLSRNSTILIEYAVNY